MVVTDFIFETASKTTKDLKASEFGHIYTVAAQSTDPKNIRR